MQFIRVYVAKILNNQWKLPRQPLLYLHLNNNHGIVQDTRMGQPLSIERNKNLSRISQWIFHVYFLKISLKYT